MIDLFIRNFDDIAPVQQTLPEPAAPEFEETTVEINLDDLVAQARQDGYDAGFQDGCAHIAAQHADSDAALMSEDHAAIKSQLAELLTQDAARVADSKRATLELLTGMAERLFPELLAAYGEQLALEQVKDALEKIHTQSEIVIKARPSIAAALEAGLADLAPQNTVRILADDTGDMARVEWREGRMEFHLDTACADVLAALRAALPPQTPPSKEPIDV